VHHRSIEASWNHWKAIAERQWARLADGLEVLAGSRPRPAREKPQAPAEAEAVQNGQDALR
jgi:hypothetical protein